MSTTDNIHINTKTMESSTQTVSLDKQIQDLHALKSKEHWAPVVKRMLEPDYLIYVPSHNGTVLQYRVSRKEDSQVKKFCIDLTRLIFLEDESLRKDFKINQREFADELHKMYYSTGADKLVVERLILLYLVAKPQMEANDVSVKDAEVPIDQSATTTFQNDAVVEEVTSTSYLPLPTSLALSSGQQTTTDIVRFMERPVVIQKGPLNTTDAIGTFAALYMPQDALTNTLFRHKLNGFLGMRMTIVIRIVVNASPMQSGRYMLFWIPCGGTPKNAKLTNWALAHSNSLMERTQLRRIELDIACDTEGIMRIPFDSSQNFYPLAGIGDTDAVGTLGYLRLAPYIALQTGAGSSVAAYTIYASFEDVELIGSAVPQMAPRLTTDSEIKSVGKGPISGLATTLSRAAKAVSPIPMISSFATTASWALDILGNTAKAFGMSKPHDLSGPTRISINSGVYMASQDGVDLSVAMAASSEHAVSTMACAATDEDEMHFNSIMGRTAWFKTQAWVTTDAADATLASWIHSPVTFRFSDTVSGLTFQHETPLTAVARLFHYWRGSIEYTVKFVKTSLHSGRLRIAYFPADTGAGVTAPTAATAPFVWNQIVDIRTCNEVKFTVPFPSSYPYRKFVDNIGSIYIFVVDPLVAPSVVPNNVQLLVEVRGGGDFEVAYPGDYAGANGGFNGGTPILGAVPQMAMKTSPCDFAPLAYGLEPSDSIINAELCIGERVTSFRQFLKIFRPILPRTSMAVAAIQSHLPYAINVAYYDSVPTLTGPTCAGDLLDLVMSWFVYSRGCVRFKFISNGTSTSVNSQFTYVKFLQGGVKPTATMSRGANDLSTTAWVNSGAAGGKYVASDIGQNRVSEVLVPHYNYTHSRVNVVHMTNSTSGYEYGNSDEEKAVPLVLGTQYALNAPAGTSSGNIGNPAFRAAADDFSLGGFISTVPYTLGFIEGYL